MNKEKLPCLQVQRRLKSIYLKYKDRESDKGIAFPEEVKSENGIYGI